MKNTKEYMDKILSSIKGIQKEYKFAPTRRYRFDYAIPDKMIAFEYEGIFGTYSRHTNIIGYTNDTEKYNLAAILGWKVLRYTAKNVKNLEKDLKLLGLLDA